jgi:hypothetical protein
MKTNTQVLNASLRETLPKHKNGQNAISGRLQQGAFSATIGAINSGLKKLARETPLSHGPFSALVAFSAKNVETVSILTCVWFCLSSQQTVNCTEESRDWPLSQQSS